MFDVPIVCEVEEVTVGKRLVQVAFVDYEFVCERLALCDDFAGGRDDGRQANLADSLFDSRLCDRNNPAAVLIRACLQS